MNKLEKFLLLVYKNAHWLGGNHLYNAKSVVWITKDEQEKNSSLVAD